MSWLEVSDISRKNGDGFLLREIGFSQQKSERIAIAGASGSGKSTLLKIIAGLIQPDNGEVRLENERIKGPDEKLVPGHSKIAYLSQHFELRNNYFVEEILSYANELNAQEANQLYKVCRVDHLLKRKTDALSGGERQRIALARLISNSPRLLLLDEPFSNLDLAHKAILKSVIGDIEEQLDITSILVSHDPDDILPWANQVIILKDGRIIQRETGFNIYHYPADAYTAGLFGKYNLINDSNLKTALGLQHNNIWNSDIFLRPEDLLIVGKQESSLTGKVRAVQYLGSHYEVEVEALNNLLTVRLEGAPPVVGDTVFIAINSNFYRRLHIEPLF